MPLSPAAGWMYTSRKGVRSRILPFATLFMPQPPARQSRVGPRARVCGVQNVKGCLFVDLLERGRQGFVLLGERLIRPARWTEQRFELRREDAPDRRLA